MILPEVQIQDGGHKPEISLSRVVMDTVVGISILSQLKAVICGSSGFVAVIFGLRFPVCQEA